MKKFVFGTAILSLAALGSAQFVENFNEDGATMISDLQSAGWVFSNQSDTPAAPPFPAEGWFPNSDFTTPPATHEGANAIATNYQVSDAVTPATLSVWMLTPNLTFNNGQTISFWTQSIQGTTVFPDRLQVRLSAAGAGSNTGTTSTDVGTFTNLLLDINPTYTNTGYPTSYAQYTITLSGLSGATSGRLGFRYFVENGGPAGANSDAITLDTLSVSPVPEPATLAGLGIGAMALIRRRRSKRA